jgi:hypothetical protein
VPRVPLLNGSRLVLADAPDDAVVLRPRPPAEAIADVAAAVRDAFRYPLSGEPLEKLVPRGGRVTVVVEPSSLPIPAAPRDPRQRALVATLAELERLGVPDERQTLLVACGLERRPRPQQLDYIVTPELARRFHGRAVVHDAEDPALVDIGGGRRVNPALLDADAVVVVSAAESVLHGGPAALLGACDAATIRAAGAVSLLETSSSSGWRAAVEVERALAARAPVLGLSLTLCNPRLAGALHGYPYAPDAGDRIARDPLRHAYGLLPTPVRERVLRAFPQELAALAAYAGPPSVAHAEALLRAIEARSARLDGQLDAICVGIPDTTPHLPRERPNPVLAATLGLGLALRLWRDAFPVADGGTAILVSGFQRRFAHPTQAPYRGFLQAVTRHGRIPDELAGAERATAADERALREYRDGRTCHPLLPYADWAGCQPALQRLGAVVIAGCRDGTAAQALGFVPASSIGIALAMAHGRAGGPPRVGFLQAPPFFPVEVAA